MVRHRYSEEQYEQAAHFRIRHKDYLHMKNLYVMMFEWLVVNHYFNRQDIAFERDDKSFPEEFYMQRETQRSGNEIWYWWRVEKVPEGNSYFKFRMDIDVHVILLRDVEVMHEGQKFKTNWGEPEIRIWSNLIFDYKHQWREHWFLKHINHLFHHRIWHHELEEKRLELYRDSYRFQEAIKTFLKMKTFLPEKELANLYPSKGLGEVK